MSRLKNKRAGFTIIEVILFLGVSSALAAAVLIGMGSGINSQRYKDTVNSLQVFLQEQYTETAHVSNVRAGNLQCVTAGTRLSVEETATDAEELGASECVVVGKVIQVEDSGEISATNIVATIPTDGVYSNDTDALGAATFGIDTTSKREYPIAWGGEVAVSTLGDDGSTQSSNRVYILRSPLSGAVMTYHSAATSTTYNDIVDNIVPSLENANWSTSFCVDSNLFGSSSNRGVLIDSRATTSNDVKQLGDGEC